jgi:predicted dehydrogenase
MTDRIRWGILGTGRIALKFAQALARLPDAEVAAVGSRAAEGAARFAGRFGIARPHASYAALVADPDVDVIYVATPHAFHAEHALLCLEAGKPVLCEKPFTLNAHETERVIAAARAKRLFLMEAMWTRYVPAIVRLRELLAAGAIGEPQLLIAGGAFIPEFNPEFYLFNRALGGGVLLDAGVYLVSLASMVFGQPDRILGHGVVNDTGIDEHDAIILGHPGGAIASLYVSLRARRPPDALLLGADGRIEVHAPIVCPRRLTLQRTGAEPEVIEPDFEGDGYHYQAIEVMRCLRAGALESPVMPLAETLSVMRTLDAVRAQLGLRYPTE